MQPDRHQRRLYLQIQIQSGTENAQPIDENLETSTARAIKTPQRHFSHIIFCHVAAQLARSSGLPRSLPGVTLGCAIADVGDGGGGDGCVGGGSDTDSGNAGVSILLSPMLGRFRSSGVQYCGANMSVTASIFVRLTHIWKCFSELWLSKVPCMTSRSIYMLVGIGRRDRSSGHLI